ncbi:hypothetical protein, partial [Pseudomonas alliivorans]|uniref:hypothetical protein n=1 Tax=Pseudomonas alliivorans TaxID=2810613 RepID=UPI00403ADC39
GRSHSAKPWALGGIISTLIEDDRSTFQCHKTVHSKRGGNWNEEGNYEPSGHELMCAGAAAYLMKKGRPTVGMRFAFATGDAAPSDWDSVREDVID